MRCSLTARGILSWAAIAATIALCACGSGGGINGLVRVRSVSVAHRFHASHRVDARRASILHRQGMLAPELSSRKRTSPLARQLERLQDKVNQQPEKLLAALVR